MDLHQLSSHPEQASPQEWPGASLEDPFTHVHLRPAIPADARHCGRICYEAFKSIAAQHSFPADFSNDEIPIHLIRSLLTNPGFYGVVAEQDGAVLGSSFLDERATIAVIGPVTVHPMAQGKGIGRRMVQHLIDRASVRSFAGVRLVQAGYNACSLSLYAKLGFVVRETLALLKGRPLRLNPSGHAVRPATAADLCACDRLCHEIHGYARTAELRDAIADGLATLIERDGALTGYTTTIGFMGHAVGRSNDDIQALIAAAAMFPGPGFLVPLSNAHLFRWCLEQDLRVVQIMTLMSIGLYNNPAGAFLPSIEC